MPSKQEIVTAIKNSELFLRVPELMGAEVKLKSNGTPFTYAGGFNMVFQLTHKKKIWAFRVWWVPIGDNKDRYEKISKYLSKAKLPYFADFFFDEKAILVSGELLDAIRMEWLEGDLLKDYIETYLKDKKKLEHLAESFLEMAKILNENKISHGDLQEGNILIEKSGKIKLVDYDSLCIPEIEGQRDLATGLRGYQHPSRFKGDKASLKADYFSELVIYLSILSIAYKPELWIKYQVKDTLYLLFTETDFEDFENSQIYKDLSTLTPLIRALLRMLLEYTLEKNYLDLVPFYDKLVPPQIKYFTTDNKPVLENNEVEIEWEVENADNISIDNNIGQIQQTGKLNITPQKSRTYTLTASNHFGKVNQPLSIDVLKKPEFITCNSNKQKIEFGKTANLAWNITNVQKVELQHEGAIEKVTSIGEKTISPQHHTTYKLIVTALDGISIFEKEVTVKVFKKVEILNFKADFEYVIETLPIKLIWDVENASSIILASNMESEIDVTGVKEIELKPKKSTIYYLKASNELLSETSDQIKIEVRPLPTLPRLDNIIPSGKDLIPSFNLNFKEVTEDIFNKSQNIFNDAMHPKSRFNFKKALNRLLKS